jgi:hypothetical protein
MKGKTIRTLLISATMATIILTGCGSKDTESEIESEITTEVETATIEETTIESETETTEEETSTIEETSTESETTTEEETTTETETFSYTVSELDKTMCVIASGQALDIPSENGNVISTIDQNDTIKVTGKVNEADWYQVNIDNQTLYISSSLLSEIEVKTETTSSNTSKETTSQNTTSNETTTKQETTTNETPQTQETTPQTQPATDNTPASTPSSSDTTTSSSSSELKVGESRVERDGSITTNNGYFPSDW